MRYILDSDGYIKHISFGSDINCGLESCTEYTGSIPSPHPSLESWYFAYSENNKLHQWKIVDGELVLDASIVIPEEKGTIDHVVEQGEKAGWTYRIWASGVQECWINSTWESLDMSNNAQFSGFYIKSFLLAFPIAFSSPPTVVIDGNAAGYVSFLKLAEANAGYATAWLMGLTAHTDPVDVNYHVYAKGKTITQTDAFLGSNALGLMRLGKGG